jgi:hypothetical protein
VAVLVLTVLNVPFSRRVGEFVDYLSIGILVVVQHTVHYEIYFYNR